MTKQNPGSKKPKRRNKFSIRSSYWGWNPVIAQEALRLAMGEMLSELFGLDSEEESPALWHPLADIYEHGKNLVIEVALPGISKDQLEIHATSDLLVIKGSADQPEKKAKYFLAEIPRGEFTRILALPHKVIPEKIRARIRQGLLTVRLPILEKKQAEKSYKIRIEE
ncbi:MAG: Hsp20/alpha crystallin family protein [Candidatus Eremiobacteraeota bacterium]|nr:Hsp20/alpha crystallin family protein [Candidatus Eremiobacteraeota bacterium]